MKKAIAAVLAMGMLLATVPAMAEETPATEAPAQAETQGQAAASDALKLDTIYTLALNAINAEDYDTAKEYLNICFAYCDPQSSPTMFADLLLKRACIDVIEEKRDMALLSLDAALRVDPELADAYLVRAEIYANEGSVDASIENLEKYIELTQNTALYETVAQLQEAKGDVNAAQAAYDKYVEGAGAEVQEAGFQAGLYRMAAGQYEEAAAAFEAYTGDETYGTGAWYNIGICRMNTADYAGAAEAFTASKDKGGDYDGLFYNRGVCRLMTGQWEDAAEDFAVSLEKENYKKDACYNLAVCRMQLGDYETAVQGFTDVIGDGKKDVSLPKWVEEDPEPEVSDSAYYYRAICRAAAGDLEGALADYTVCIDHEYALAQVYYERAQVYGLLGDTEKQNGDLQNSLKYTH